MNKLDKYLLIVNKQNQFNEDMLNDFKFDTVYDTDGKTRIEKETHKAFLALNDYMIKNYGCALFLTSALRTTETQQKVFDEFVKENSLEEALNYVALPGTSEHHTGLAIDVKPELAHSLIVEKLLTKLPIPERLAYLKQPDKEGKDQMYADLHKSLSKFGFILRYTKDKKDITGFNAERWHIRYVGKEHAKAIESSGLCLEEYVMKLQNEPQDSQPGLN